MSKARGFLCGPRIYQYNGWLFEFSQAGGPWPLKKDGELRKRAGRTFYKMFDEFWKREDKEEYRVGGGCQQF